MEEKRNGERITYSAKILTRTFTKKEQYAQILRILEKYNKPMTAKEIAMILFQRGLLASDEQKIIATRLAEMVKKKYVEAVDKIYCDYSGKDVMRYKIMEEKWKQ